MTEKSSKRALWMFPVLVILLLAALAGWFFTTHTWVVKDSRQILTAEAKKNRYFVAQQVLEKMGKTVETQKGREVLLNLPSPDHAIIVKDIGHSFTDKRIDAMVDWLNSGGHIITFADVEKADDEADSANKKKYRGNRLLMAVGVYVTDMMDIASADDDDSDTDAHDDADSDATTSSEDESTTADTSTLAETETATEIATETEATVKVAESAETSADSPEDTAEDKSSQAKKDSTDDASPKSLTELIQRVNDIKKAKDVTFQVDGQPITVRFAEDASLTFDDESLNVISSQTRQTAQGRQYYLVDIGFENQGRLTVLTGDDFLHNPKPKLTKDDLVGEVKNLVQTQTTAIDEVDHAYLLWHLVKDDKKVWLLPSIDAPSLSELLWQRARYACISFVLLLLAWIMWQVGRFGPIRQQVFRSRRNILEHLSMIGDFAWRVDKAEKLFEQHRATVKAMCLKKYPMLQNQLGADFSELLSERIDMSSAAIQKALFSKWQNESGFIEYSYLLQELREKL